jgi:hypothetical protein
MLAVGLPLLCQGDEITMRLPAVLLDEKATLIELPPAPALPVLPCTKAMLPGTAPVGEFNGLNFVPFA